MSKTKVEGTYCDLPSQARSNSVDHKPLPLDLWHCYATGNPAAKRVLRRLDHAAIFLLIAGTYTPFTLVNLRGGWGWTLFGLVWGFALLGVVLETVLKRRIKWLSLSLYLGLGWLVVIAIEPLLDAVEPGGLILLLAGGLCYSLGVIFYVWKRLAYHHAVWHLFVMAGSLLHFFSIFFYVLPPATS